MAGFGVEWEVVNQVSALPGSPRVADGCWQDGQKMTGCSQDLENIPAPAGSGTSWSGEDADPTPDAEVCGPGRVTSLGHSEGLFKGSAGGVRK